MFDFFKAFFANKLIDFKITPRTQQLDRWFECADQVRLLDHMPPVGDIRINIDGEPQYFKNSIIKLFNDAGIDYKHKKFLANQYLFFEDFENFAIDAKNNIFLRDCKNFNTISKFINASDNDIKYHFTFMSNTAREQRTLAACIIPNLFDINKVAYSYVPGRNDNLIVDELFLNTNYPQFDKSKILPKNWFRLVDTEEEKDYGGYENRLPDFKAFIDLHKLLYKNSATSIVTEPCFFEKAGCLTEKTPMSIYSKHFMIWIGSYKLPDAIKTLGIDIFEDIIDHSYQYIEHPGERVVEAFLRNYEFLKNIELQQQLRAKHFDRLTKNLSIIQNTKQLENRLSNLGKK